MDWFLYDSKSMDWFLYDNGLRHKRVNISLFVFPLHDSFPVDALRVKHSSKYSTYFPPSGATNGFNRNRNNRDEIIRKIVSVKIEESISCQHQEFCLYFKTTN